MFRILDSSVVVYIKCVNIKLENGSNLCFVHFLPSFGWLSFIIWLYIHRQKTTF